MFFEPSDFEDLPDPAHKRIAAITANNIIGQLGVNLFGRFYEDGSALDFSTELNKDTDTHACIGINMEMMGMRRKHGAPLKMDVEPSEKDKEHAKDLLIQQQQRELHNLRNK